jgi:hypothetical protein
MTFDDVLKLGRWAPIRNCPGRYVLRGAAPTFNPTDLLKDGIEARRYLSPRARDDMWVVRLEDGGLISYERPDGTWLHTLNTNEGFERKIRQLEIEIDGD